MNIYIYIYILYTYQYIYIYLYLFIYLFISKNTIGWRWRKMLTNVWLALVSGCSRAMCSSNSQVIDVNPWNHDALSWPTCKCHSMTRCLRQLHLSWVWLKIGRSEPYGSRTSSRHYFMATSWGIYFTDFWINSYNPHFFVSHCIPYVTTCIYICI